MEKSKLLDNIFSLAKQGIYVPIDNLPSNISKDVVQKQLLYIELKNLVKSGNNPARVEELKAILNPEQGDDEYVD